MPPMPPADLRYNVSAIRDEALFDQLGRQSIVDFSRALSSLGRSIGDFHRILEWGCGCGRILRHLEFDPTRQEVHGCDIDPKGIAWLRENMPALQVIANEGLPPLPYPDGHFDLILNHSVLTHLDEAYQDAWLAELQRILAPGGIALLTVHGPFAHEAWAANLPSGSPELARALVESRRMLAERGIYFLVDNGWSENFPEYYQNTFHAPWYIFESWTRFFDIAGYIPQGSLSHQDMVILRQRQSVQRAPAQAEIARLRQEVLALRSSTSWRITAPLRRLAGWLKRG